LRARPQPSLIPETYNTALEQHLRDTLGVRFAERPGTDPAKRPIREIVGVDPRLNQRWSTRRAKINVRRGELAIQFQQDHGRPPTPVEVLQLAQQATLETRDAKHEPRSLAEQRATWLNEAAAVLGGQDAVEGMVQTTLAPPAESPTIADSLWVAETADHILTVMEESRSTWQMWHVRAEAQRQVRTIHVPAEPAAALVDLLVDEVRWTSSFRIWVEVRRTDRSVGVDRSRCRRWLSFGGQAWAARRLVMSQQSVQQARSGRRWRRSSHRTLRGTGAGSLSPLAFSSAGCDLPLKALEISPG
jgi:TrwC relaxase